MAAGVIVLEDTEEEHTHTEAEIVEYAEFLGIDPEQEPHLMWIAREGVAAPIPSPWKACTQNGDDIFYFNFETGESVWDHPSDEKYKQLVEDERAKEEVDDAADQRMPVEPAEEASDHSPHDVKDDKASDHSPHDVKDDKASDHSPHDIKDDKASAPNTSGLEEDRKRLELITNEISDEESLSPKSHHSPLNGSLDSPSSSSAPLPIPTLNDSLNSQSSSAAPPSAMDRGSAGVGLAPAGSHPADTSLDKSVEAANRSVDTPQSSPSLSGSRTTPPLHPRDSHLGNGGCRVLETSGASGQSGLSEVSEDFPSDFDGRSEKEGSGALGGRTTPLGDTLELSATMDDLPPAPTVTAEKLATTGRVFQAWATLKFSTQHSGSKEEAQADRPHPGVCTDTPDCKSTATPRLSKLKDEMAILARVLSKLSEIRGQQREYLQLLQASK